MAEARKRTEVENDLIEGIAAFAAGFHDERERTAAKLALCRRIVVIVADEAMQAATHAKLVGPLRAWLAVVGTLSERVSSCELCGGTGEIRAAVTYDDDPRFDTLAVPCPACGGRS